MHLPYFEHFGIDADLGRTVLSRALSRGGDHADLYFEHRVSAVMVLDDGRIQEIDRAINLGCGVRVLAGDRREDILMRVREAIGRRASPQSDIRCSA
jgi:hypothetical protein